MGNASASCRGEPAGWVLGRAERGKGWVGLAKAVMRVACEGGCRCNSIKKGIHPKPRFLLRAASAAVRRELRSFGIMDNFEFLEEEIEPSVGKGSVCVGE